MLRALELFQELYPRAGAPVRLGLSIAQGDDFKTLIRQYLSNRLEKGVPSLFSDVKGYYAEQGKREMVEAIVEELKDNLEKVGTLDGSTGEPYLCLPEFVAQMIEVTMFSPNRPHATSNDTSLDLLLPRAPLLAPFTLQPDASTDQVPLLPQSSDRPHPDLTRTLHRPSARAQALRRLYGCRLGHG